MKKLLASVVVMILLVSCCLIAAFPTSASDINYDDFWISEDGIIVEYLGAGGDVVVPSVDADGNPITGIDTRAFADNMDVTTVVISEGIETIGYEAFQFCRNLVEVSLPYSLKEAGYSTFRGTGITSIVIPAQLKYVPADFVSSGDSVTCKEVVISEGVEEIETASLKGGFTRFVFPKSVYSIGSYFYGGMVSSIKSVDIYIINPDCEIEAVGKHAFKSTVGEGVGPLVYRYATEGLGGEIKVYAEKGSTVEDYFNEYMKDKDQNCRFVGKDAEFFEPYQQECLDKGKYAPLNNSNGSNPNGNGNGNTDPNGNGTNNTDPNGNGNGTSNNSNNNNKNNNNNNNKNNNSNTQNKTNGGVNAGLILTVLAIAGGFIVLIIIVVVVLLIVMSNKKKKKKKAKKVAEVVAEDAVAEEVVEEIAEESGEEE